MALADRIREARGDMSQRELADRVGCTARSISLWETTDRQPELIFLRRIALATSKPLEFFFEELEVAEGGTAA